MTRTYAHSTYEDLGAITLSGGIAEDFTTDHLLIKLKLRFRGIIGKPDKQYGCGVVVTEETSKETVFKYATDLTRALTKHYHNHVMQYNLPFGKVLEDVVLDTLERMAKDIASFADDPQLTI